MDHNLPLHFQLSTAVAERGRVTELIPNDRTNSDQQQGHKLMKHEMRKPPTKLNHHRRVPLQKSDYNGNGDGYGSPGMRAFFLVRGSGNTSGTAAGTGVFLPRPRCTSANNNNNSNNSTESRREPRCSTVLIPSRVTQALKLHFQKMGGPSSPLQQGIAEGRNIGTMCIYPNNNMIITHQPPSLSSSSTAPYLHNYNNTAYLRLPEEWIY